MAQKWVGFDDGDGDFLLLPASGLQRVFIAKCDCEGCDKKELFKIQANFESWEDAVLGCGYSSEDKAKEVFGDLLLRIQNEELKDPIVSARKPKD